MNKEKQGPGTHPLGRGGDFLAGALAFLTPARLGLAAGLLLVAGAFLPLWSPARPQAAPDDKKAEPQNAFSYRGEGRAPNALGPTLLASAAVVLVLASVRSSPGLLASGAGLALFVLSYLAEFLFWRDEMRATKLYEAGTPAVAPQGWALLFLGAACAALAGWRARHPD